MSPNFIEPREKTERLSKEESPRHQFIVELAQKVRWDDDAREIWKNKQIVASNMRLGVRKRSSRPNQYQGYAEVPIPVTDKIIKKKKASLVAVATAAKKQIVVGLIPGVRQPEGARERANKIEKALNGLVRKRDFGWLRKISLLADYVLENGHGVMKVIEKFKSLVINRKLDIREFPDEVKDRLSEMTKAELAQVLADREGMDLDDADDKLEIDRAVGQFKDGEEILEFTKRDVFSEPEVIPERGLRIIVPAGTTDIQRTPRVTHDMWMTYTELRAKADAGVYAKSVVDALKPDQGTQDDSLTSSAWSLAEGVSKDEAKGNSELFNVRECQTWYENKGELEKWVFTWIEQVGNSDKPDSGDNSSPRSIKVLQEMPHPYDHGMWTYVKFDNEVKSPRWYASRGIPEQIRGMHHIMEKMFNARVIRDEYNNNPMFRVSRQLGFSGQEIQFKPGQVIEAEQGEIEQINKAITTDISSERIEQQAKAYIEEYQSVLDFTVRSAISEGGGSRTATEIAAVQGANQQQLNTEVMMFLESLSDVAQQMYLILKQSVTGPRVIGGTILTPDDFMVQVDVSWNGSVEASNHQLQQAKALQRMDILSKLALPIGIMTQENLYFALRDWLEQDPDVIDPDMFITRPQEIQVDQAEDQMQEIVMMQAGFNPVVKPTDNHNVHIQVIEAYVNSPAGAGAMQANPQFAQSIEQHINIHLEAEKGMKQGGNTDDPRRKRVLQTFTNGNKP